MHKIKKTGIEWLPEISKDFSVGYVKQYFNISKDLSNEGEPERVLKLARSGIVEKDVTMNEGQMAASYAGYNKVLVGDLLLNPMDLYSGANCNVSQLDGVISPAYLNLRAKKAQTVIPKFYDYYFKTQYWIMAMFAHGKGVSFDNRWTLNNDSLRSYEIPVLPYLSQKRIVQKIQSEEQNVDALIVNQQTQIEKLKQYKQSLITEVVTKGLNPDVPMKDSGVEWIGMIPKNWIVKRTKFIANALEKGKGITKEEVISDGDIQCVRYGEIYTKYNQGFTDCVSKTNLEIIQPHQFFEHGDILFAGTGELVEEIGKNVVYLGNKKCLAGGDIIVMKHNQDPAFLNYALNSIYSQRQKSYGKAKLKVVHISADNIGNVKIALPPLDEQQQIATYLDDKCTKIDRLIAIKQEKIDKLNNYKKSLIYEYVTGKREVC